MSKLVILLGPPGSLKTTTSNAIFKSSKRKPLLLNIDDFVYNNPAYKADRASTKLTGRPESDMKPLQDLFDKYIVRASAEFKAAAHEAVANRKDVVIDQAGRDIRWLVALSKEVEQKKYQVHLIYPRVGSLTVLLNRVLRRFGQTARGQTPAPRAVVEDCTKGVHKNFIALVHAFEHSLVRLVIFDSSQDSGASTQVFEYLPKANKCKVFDGLELRCSRV